MRAVINPTALKGLIPTEPTEPTVKPVDNKIRQDWNDYVKWLDSKGLKGHASLDKNDLGGKMIDEYRKVNPTTLISREAVIPIQNEFSKYRDYALNEIKNKRATFAPGADENNFMKALSIVDGKAGQRTTSFQFPDVYLRTFDPNRKLISVENKGFSTINR